MPKYSFSLDRRCFWLLLPLAGAFTACGSDASTSPAAQRDSQPSSSDGDDVEDDDEGDDESDDEPDTDADDAEGEKSSLDAALPKPGQGDAGRGNAARADAGGADAGSPPKQVDAATAHHASDAATDVASDGATSDASAPAQSQDAASSAADAQMPSTARTFKVDSKDEWSASGFQVEAGRCYQIDVKIDDRWLDLDVPADLTGWVDKDDVRLILFEPLRRVAQDDIGFYQFATCVNKKLNQCFPVNTSSNVCPKSAGELFFFVNDVSGFESNNVGTATVTIQAK